MSDCVTACCSGKATTRPLASIRLDAQVKSLVPIEVRSVIEPTTTIGMVTCEFNCFVVNIVMIVYFFFYDHQSMYNWGMHIDTDQAGDKDSCVWINYHLCG